MKDPIMQDKFSKKIAYGIILTLTLSTSTQYVSAAETTTKSDSNKSKESSATLEKATAAARLLLSSAQAYTDEYQDLSPRMQGGIDIATSIARIANFYAQYQNNNDIQKYHMINAPWAAYDAISALQGCIKVLSSNSMSTGNALDEFLTETSDIIPTTENNNADKEAESASLEQARKAARVLAGFVEGATALGASFYSKEAKSQNVRVRLHTACSLARCIERALGVETKELRVAMGVAALANLAWFAYTCTKDFDKEAEEEAAEAAKKAKKNKVLSTINKFTQAARECASTKDYSKLEALKEEAKKAFTLAKEVMTTEELAEIRNNVKNGIDFAVNWGELDRQRLEALIPEGFFSDTPTTSSAASTGAATPVPAAGDATSATGTPTPATENIKSMIQNLEKAAQNFSGDYSDLAKASLNLKYALQDPAILSQAAPHLLEHKPRFIKLVEAKKIDQARLDAAIEIAMVD